MLRYKMEIIAAEPSVSQTLSTAPLKPKPSAQHNQPVYDFISKNRKV